MTGHESKGYAPLVFALNAALDRLRDIKVGGLRDPDTMNILFHRQDPSIIIGGHGSGKVGVYVHIFVHASCLFTFSSRLESSIYATTAYYRPGLN